MLGKFTALLAALFAIIASFSAVQAASAGGRYQCRLINSNFPNLDRILGTRLLKKASKPVEWDDLGFAWGKRSVPVALEIPEGSPLEQVV